VFRSIRQSAEDESSGAEATFVSRKTRVIVATGIVTAIIAVTMSVAGVFSVAEASRTTTASQPGAQKADPDNSEEVMAIRNVVTRAIDYRNHRIVSGTAPATMENVDEYFTPDAAPAVLQDFALLEGRQEQLVPFAVVHTASRSDIAFQDIVAGNGKATARVKEQTTLGLAPINGIQGPDEGYVYEQLFELSQSGGVWKISGTRPVNPLGLGPPTVIDPRSRAALSSPAAHAPSPSAPGASHGASAKPSPRQAGPYPAWKA
jgi:hypothetical protein